ncbi:MAG TPA: SAM-dependent methyltransferase [Trebonia sp.]|nr:SAM-dependent methyltransferase [Trebonia sp.]
MVHQLDDELRSSAGFNVSVPNSARLWNYWLGGKDNFAADRAAAQEAARALPLMPAIARVARRFVLAAVWELAKDGICQFLDIGMGLPVNDECTHEVAQCLAPDVRVVYVDNDPIAASHGRALLARGGIGITDCLELDLRDTSEILAAAGQTLDFSQPVAVLLSAVLDFIPDAADPWGPVAQLVDALAPGSYLMIAHVASDIEPAAVAAMAEAYNERAASTITPRSQEQVARFFDGMTLTHPGVVPATGWYGPDDAVGALPAYFGLGVKPARSRLTVLRVDRPRGAGAPWQP